MKEKKRDKEKRQGEESDESCLEIETFSELHVLFYYDVTRVNCVIMIRATH